MTVTEKELNKRLPIISHAAIADTDCPGCLVIRLNDSTCGVLCNECGSLIARPLPVADIENFFQNLYIGTRRCKSSLADLRYGSARNNRSVPGPQTQSRKIYSL